MRHRESLRYNLVRAHIDHASAVAPPITPAVDHVAARDDRHEGRLSIPHGETIQVTSVFRDELRDERRAPQGPEAMPVVERGKAVELGIDKNKLSGVVHGDIVRVEIARREGGARDEEPVVAL